jgi:EF hand
VGSETKISLESFTKVCDIIVEKVEMRRRAVQKFHALDADKSGFLENAELTKGTYRSVYYSRAVLYELSLWLKLAYHTYLPLTLNFPLSIEPGITAHIVVDFMYFNLGVSLAEDHEAAKKDMMSRVDANADGKLDLSEFINLFEDVYVKSKKALAGITLAPP